MYCKLPIQAVISDRMIVLGVGRRFKSPACFASQLRITHQATDPASADHSILLKMHFSQPPGSVGCPALIKGLNNDFR